MKRIRSNPKDVKRQCSRLLELYRICVREHWTLDRYVAERKAFWEAQPDRTRGDSSEIWGYSRALWDALHSVHLVWRLGDVTGPIPEGLGWPYGERADGSRNLPTHGAHCWRGTDIPFDGWKSLSVDTLNGDKQRQKEPPPALDDGIPACAASMGCLCAGHARGNPADAACDTSE